MNASPTPSAADLARQAAMELAAGRASEAIEAAQAALDIDRASPLAYAIRALALTDIQPRAAAGDVRHALELDPQSELAHLAMAVLAERAKDFSTARAAAEQSLATNPDNARARWIRARCSLAIGDHDAAWQDSDLLLAATHGPAAAGLHELRSQVLRAQGRLADAAVEATRGLDLSPDVNLLRLRAQVRCALGHLPEALADIETALAAQPAGGDCLACRAEILAAQAADDRARDDLERAFVLGVADARPLLALRAELQRRQGAFERALADIETALLDDPNIPEWLAQRAEIWLALEDVARAARDAQRALVLAPQLARALAVLAALQASGAALPPLEAASAEDGTPNRQRAALLIERARSLIAQRRFDVALGDLDAALAADPNAGEACRLRSQCQREQGDYHAALAAAEDAIVLLGKTPPALACRAAAHLALGAFPMAIQDADLALMGMPHLAVAMQIRGVARRRTGDFPAALADLRRALALGADAMAIQEELRLATQHETAAAVIRIRLTNV